MNTNKLNEMLIEQLLKALKKDFKKGKVCFLKPNQNLLNGYRFCENLKVPLEKCISDMKIKYGEIIILNNMTDEQIKSLI